MKIFILTEQTDPTIVARMIIGLVHFLEPSRNLFPNSKQAPPVYSVNSHIAISVCFFA